MRLFRSSRSPAKRTVARHEQLLFYPSVGAKTADGTGWTLFVQGRVFDPRIWWVRRRPMLAVMKRVLQMDQCAEEYFRIRMRQFLMFGLRGRSITVRVGEVESVVAESDYMGLFSGQMPISNEQLTAALAGIQDRIADANRPWWLEFKARLNENDDRDIVGKLQMVPPRGISIISDVDDTIKHSNVPNRRDLFRNTFTRTFVPIGGMPELYQACAQSGAAFHFVSGSPWQLYEPLSEFMAAEGYPSGSFHLKRFRIRDSARKIRMSPQKAHKRAAIEPILEAYPHRRFILIGDSGEQDPEIYASFLREKPQQIAGVFIRAVRGESRDAPRLTATFEGVDPARWIIYNEPSEISDLVIDLVNSCACPGA